MEQDSHRILLSPGHLLSSLIPEENEAIKSLNQELNQLGHEIFNYNCPENKKKEFTRFIGGHPVSLNNENLRQILNAKGDFLVCEKSDGVRYIFIVMNTGECYLHGRKMNDMKVGDDDRQYFAVNLKMPELMDSYSYERAFWERDQSLGKPAKRIRHIFDAELVEDCYESGDKTPRRELKLLIFDTLHFNYILVISRSYDKRLELVNEFIKDYKMKRSLVKKMEGKTSLYINESCGARIKFFLKDFYDVDRTELIFNYLIPGLAHKNDGLIFTRNSAPYKTDRNDDIIKWKPPHLNTIDFQVVQNSRFNNTKRYGDDLKNKVFDLYVKARDENGEGCIVLFDFLFADELTFKTIKAEMRKSNESHMIVECSYSIEEENKFLEHIYSVEEQESLKKFDENSIGNLIFKLGVDQSNKLETGKKDFRDRMEEYRGNGFQGLWKFSQFRLDKTSPNSDVTAKNVLASIKENINKSVLLAALNGGERKKAFAGNK